MEIKIVGNPNEISALINEIKEPRGECKLYQKPLDIDDLRMKGTLICQSLDE